MGAATCQAVEAFRSPSPWRMSFRKSTAPGSCVDSGACRWCWSVVDDLHRGLGRSGEVEACAIDELHSLQCRSVESGSSQIALHELGGHDDCVGEVSVAEVLTDVLDAHHVLAAEVLTLGLLIFVRGNVLAFVDDLCGQVGVRLILVLLGRGLEHFVHGVEDTTFDLVDVGVGEVGVVDEEQVSAQGQHCTDEAGSSEFDSFEGGFGQVTSIQIRVGQQVGVEDGSIQVGSAQVGVAQDHSAEVLLAQICASQVQVGVELVVARGTYMTRLSEMCVVQICFCQGSTIGARGVGGQQVAHLVSFLSESEFSRI